MDMDLDSSFHTIHFNLLGGSPGIKSIPTIEIHEIFDRLKQNTRTKL